MIGNEQENRAWNAGNMTLEQKINRIAELNDIARSGKGDHILAITQGILELGNGVADDILVLVRSYSRFEPENDPHGEHDFGSFNHACRTVFWKMDCYDKQMEYGSPDPTDTRITQRVLTVMLASEY